MASSNSDSRLQSSETLAQECVNLELGLAELKAAYEQYFIGIDRHAPTRQHELFRQKLLKLRSAFVRSTVVKFRVQTLQARVTSFERMWTRTVQEIENGTYHRDLFKARRRQGQATAAGAKRGRETETGDARTVPQNSLSDALSAAEASLDSAFGSWGDDGPAALSTPAVPPPLPPRGSNPALAKVAGPANPQALTEARVKAVYDAFVEAKKRCNEDTSSLSLDSLAASLRSQVPELLKKHNAKDVDFKVVIKDGKASLRAVPKL